MAHDFAAHALATTCRVRVSRYATHVPNRVRDSLKRRSLEAQDFDGVLVMRDGRPYDPAWDLWRPTRRWPGILAAAVVTMVLLGVVAFHFEHHVNPPNEFSGPTIHARVHGAYFPPVADNAPGVQTFTGTTSESRIPFVSPGGMSSWTFQCKCRANFAITVRNAAGVIVDIPINAVGRTRLATTAGYFPGHFTFDVIADGHWKIQFIDQAKLPLVATPFRYLSSGTSVLGPFPASATTLEVDYIGQIGNFTTVQVQDKKDSLSGYAVFASQSGSKTVTLTPPNPYYLIVKSGGLWYVHVS